MVRYTISTGFLLFMFKSLEIENISGTPQGKSSLAMLESEHFVSKEIRKESEKNLNAKRKHNGGNYRSG